MGKHRSQLDAIVLAGGLGTRLRSALPDVPKPLAPVNGRPFLDFHLALLAESGLVRKVVLAVGHLADRIIDHYERTPGPLPTEFVVEDALLGTGGAARRALAATTGARVLVMNGDSLFRWELATMLAAHEKLAPAATMALVHVPDTRRYGAVEFDGAHIRRFVEKAEAVGPGCINAGVYLFERDALEALPEHKVISLERDVFPGLAVAGRLGGVPHQSEFVDIGLPESYQAAARIVPALVGDPRQ